MANIAYRTLRHWLARTAAFPTNQLLGTGAIRLFIEHIGQSQVSPVSASQNWIKLICSGTSNTSRTVQGLTFKSRQPWLPYAPSGSRRASIREALGDDMMAFPATGVVNVLREYLQTSEVIPPVVSQHAGPAIMVALRGTGHKTLVVVELQIVLSDIPSLLLRICACNDLAGGSDVA